VERSPERPTAMVAEVYAIAEAIESRFRALVLTAAFSSLRPGELFASRRGDLDRLHKEVRVTRHAQTLGGGGVLFTPRSREVAGEPLRFRRP
jgi:integrase